MLLRILQCIVIVQWIRPCFSNVFSCDLRSFLQLHNILSNHQQLPSSGTSSYNPIYIPRGGSTTVETENISIETILQPVDVDSLSKQRKEVAYQVLATALRPSILNEIKKQQKGTNEEQLTIKSISSSLRTLSKSQGALKKIDGASHQLYQRSHDTKVSASSKKGGSAVAGRAARSAARTGCCADALFACELLDFFKIYRSILLSSENSGGEIMENEEFTLSQNGGREIIWQGQLSSDEEDIVPLNVMILYEKNYVGGAGIKHGGIDSILSDDGHTQRISVPPRGRFLIILNDEYEEDLAKTIYCIDETPEFVSLNTGRAASKAASLNGKLWRTAYRVLESSKEYLCDNDNKQSDSNNDNDVKDEQKSEKNGMKQKPDAPLNTAILPAIHFVGNSLAGGVASLAAAMLDGSIPIPNKRRSSHPRDSKIRQSSRSKGGTYSHSSDKHELISSKSTSKKGGNNTDEDTASNETDASQPIQGYGKGRTSALILGSPPCLSANVKAPFITSVIHGDDIVSRATKQSLDTLRQRTIKALGAGIFTKNLGWMADTLSLTVSSIAHHAHGNDGEEARLSLPGNVYLVRPRSIGGGISSMHEIGTAGGREALRASVLWQLNDVLLSRSLWAHHSLEAYIVGLDKVQLREFQGDDDEE